MVFVVSHIWANVFGCLFLSACPLKWVIILNNSRACVAKSVFTLQIDSHVLNMEAFPTNITSFTRDIYYIDKTKCSFITKFDHVIFDGAQVKCICEFSLPFFAFTSIKFCCCCCCFCCRYKYVRAEYIVVNFSMLVCILNPCILFWILYFKMFCFLMEYNAHVIHLRDNDYLL